MSCQKRVKTICNEGEVSRRRRRRKAGRGRSRTEVGSRCTPRGDQAAQTRASARSTACPCSQGSKRCPPRSVQLGADLQHGPVQVLGEVAAAAEPVERDAQPLEQLVGVVHGLCDEQEERRARSEKPRQARDREPVLPAPLGESAEAPLRTSRTHRSTLSGSIARSLRARASTSQKSAKRSRRRRGGAQVDGCETSLASTRAHEEYLHVSSERSGREENQRNGNNTHYSSTAASPPQDLRRTLTPSSPDAPGPARPAAPSGLTGDDDAAAAPPNGSRLSAVASERREWSALSADDEVEWLREEGAEVERGRDEEEEARTVEEEDRGRDDAVSCSVPAVEDGPGRRDEVDPPADARRRRFSACSSPPARGAPHPKLSSSRCRFLPISALARSISPRARSISLRSSASSLLPLAGVLIASSDTRSSASPNRARTSSALVSLRTIRAFLSRNEARSARDAENGSDQRAELCSSRAWRRSAAVRAAARCVTVFSSEAKGSGGAVEVEAALSAVRGSSVSLCFDRHERQWDVVEPQPTPSRARGRTYDEVPVLLRVPLLVLLLGPLGDDVARVLRGAPRVSNLPSARRRRASTTSLA